MATETGIIRKYELSEEEFSLAAVFTDLQLKYLQSMLYECYHDKITAAYDPESKDGMQRYIMEQEYNRGAVVVLETIINTHNNVLEKIIAANEIAANPNLYSE